MKKITSITLGLLTLVFFVLILPCDTDYFCYGVSNRFGYVGAWLIVLFILNIFALKLNNIKYKKWLILSFIVALIAIYSSYSTGDGGQTIMSLDGESVNMWFASLYSIVSVIYFVADFFINRRRLNLNKNK